MSMKVNPRSGLTDEQLSALRAQLMKARREIFARARRWRIPGEGDPLEQGTPIGDAGDLAELSHEQALSVELGEADRRRLHDIDDALARADQGSYGICEATGEPIGFDRLAVEPWARYTSAYQELLEAATGTGHPPTL
jgi:DnaK suppressor protein